MDLCEAVAGIPVMNTITDREEAVPVALPMLRRYMRAVIGDQLVGDRLASALWSQMPPDARQPGDPARLFGAATRAWRRARTQAPARSFSRRSLTDSVPAGLTVPRQAGLLIDVFGLSVTETSVVLDRSEGEVTRLLAATRRERREPLEIGVLVVEDNPLIAEHLARIAIAQGARVRTAPDHARALQAARHDPPQVAICDYDLGDGPNGVEVVRALTSEHDCVCLFVTAYPEEVLQGADDEPAFVLSKPFAEDRVAAALHYAARAERPALLAA